MISINARNFNHYQIVSRSNVVHKSSVSLSVFVPALISDMLYRYLCSILTRTVRAVGTPSIGQERKVICDSVQPKLLIEILAIDFAVNKKIFHRFQHLKTSGCFQVPEFYALPTESICVFCLDLRINSNQFRIQC
jgi:hypothetical protein